MDCSLALEREIERGEAVWWIPAPAVRARTGTRERVMIWSYVPKRFTSERRRLDGVNSSENLRVDHVRLDEDALGHCVNGA